MLNEQILQSIECVIPHKCTAVLNGCAQCAIDYKYIAHEPTTLQCGHHICSECKITHQKSQLNCKICGTEIKNLGVISSPAEAWITSMIKDLALVLNEKYTQAFDLYCS